MRPVRAAEALATRKDWGDLYDDDMFVDADLSLETAAHVGNTEAWVTNELEHDGLRLGDVVQRLTARVSARGCPLHG
ncbi:hypothetical protein [Cellulosimicrobium arenosum]|uniref:Uncharacterized protein n=1 Tax=Cellulosimicrobium arenosum TaxID=2708133 RepID=A0A927GBE4_9MICO|nr:hypothetical protein [Cellulosimicrobium arenosum]MBD8079440.1 hypothetical protein [Cellulosimicrobium arenosum]